MGIYDLLPLGGLAVAGLLLGLIFAFFSSREQKKRDAARRSSASTPTVVKTEEAS